MQPHRWAVAAAAAAAMMAPTVRGQLCDPQELPWMGPGVSRVELLGNTILTGEWHRGLGIFDRTDPLAPQPVGLYQATGGVGTFAVEAGRAYVSVGDGVVQILDVSDPRSPAPLGSFEVVERAGFVAVSGRLAFVTAPSGLWMFEVSDPTSPYLAGIVEEGGPAHIVTSGSHVYMGAGFDGVKIVDFSNWLDLQLVGSLPLPGKVVNRVHVSGSLLFAGTSSGMDIIDVADPTQPVLIGSTGAEPTDIFDVQVAGNVAVVVSSWDGVRFYDVSNPAAPTLLSTLETPGDAYSARIEGNLLYVADAHRGIAVVDIADPSAPLLVSPGDYLVPQSPHAITVQADIAYIADGAGGLAIVDVADPAVTRGLGAITGTNWFARDIAVSGNLAFLYTTTAGLQIIDVASPNSPALISTIGGGGPPIAGPPAIAAAGPALYISRSVVDVSDPASPVQLGLLLGAAADLAVAGDRLYSTNGTSVFVHSIADPLNPALIGSGVGLYAQDISVDGHRGITGGFLGASLWDLRDDSTPTVLGTWPIADWVRDVAINGDIAVVVLDGGDVQILDVSDLRAPVLLESFNHAFGIPLAAEITHEAAYIAYEYANVQVIDLRSCRRCAADLNRDGLGDIADLLVYLDRWFAADFLADVDDGVGVDVFDLLTFLDRWFEGCPN